MNITYEEYFALMTSAGFSPREIRRCWESPYRDSILLAFVNNN